MITIKFEPIDEPTNRYRREVVTDPSAGAFVDEVTIPIRVYPGTTSEFERDLHERSEEELRAIGREIAELALGERGLQAVDEQRSRASGARIEFVESARAAGAAAVPWELMYHDDEYMALNSKTPILRLSAEAPPVTRFSTRAPSRALVFWSSPDDQPPVDIEMEQIRLSLALASHMQRKELDAFEQIHCTRSRLDEALAAGDYDLVYFTGHGTYQDAMGYLCLQKDDGGTDLLSAVEFARKLAIQKRPPALAFLNCCLSAAAGQTSHTPGRFLDVGRRLLREGVPYVAATLTPVFVATAQKFMETFLRFLFMNAEFDVARAMAAARAAVFEDHAAPLPLRQSFFQYLLLTTAAEDCVHVREKAADAMRPAAVTPVLHSSLNYPGHGATWVQRNHFMLEVESAFLNGAMAVGVDGLGGLGKTIFSVQFLERVGAHVNPRLRAGRALWLDLRAREGMSGLIINQLCHILLAAGQAEGATSLQKDPNPHPPAVARLLSQALGPDCFLVLDNCETLLGPDGSPADPYTKALIASLIGQTGWRTLLTSRERFSLAEEGRDPWPIRWMRVGELSTTERAALLRFGLTQSRLNLDTLDESLIRLIVAEVAAHPYELNLFLRDADPDSNLEETIKDVHRRTGDYACLEYYVRRAPETALPLLQLIAALDEPTGERLLSGMWRFLAEGRGWSQEPTEPKESLRCLVARGLVEHGDGDFWVLPVLRNYLFASGAFGSVPPAEAVQLHHDLTWFFQGYSQSIAEQAKALHDGQPGLSKEGVNERLAQLSSARAAFLHRSLRHALRQENIRMIGERLERFVDEVTGRVPLGCIAAYAREFESLLDRLAGAPSEPQEDIGLCFGVVGQAYAAIRDWTSALSAYQRSVSWFQKTSQHRYLGITYHQLGMVYAEQRRWKEALENYRLARVSYLAKVCSVSFVLSMV